MPGSPDYAVIVANRAGLTVGFCVLFLPCRVPFGLVEYIGVDASRRGGSIGSTMMAYALDYASTSGHDTMLFEVESDRAPGAEQRNRQRRQTFYRQLGCRRLDQLAYLLPLETDPPPPPMDLFVWREKESVPVAGAMLREWLTLLYVHVYDGSASHPRIDLMMAPMSDPVALI